jgi:hypothetical protein
MWTREILPFIASLVAVTLWSLLSAPQLLRPFGVSISINPKKRKNLTWDLRQSMLMGAVVWGVGMIIFGITDTFIIWRLSGNPSDRPTIAGFGVLVLKWTLGGVVFGFFTFLSNGKRSESQPNRKP